MTDKTTVQIGRPESAPPTVHFWLEHTAGDVTLRARHTRDDRDQDVVRLRWPSAGDNRGGGVIGFDLAAENLCRFLGIDRLSTPGYEVKRTQSSVANVGRYPAPLYGIPTRDMPHAMLVFLQVLARGSMTVEDLCALRVHAPRFVEILAEEIPIRLANIADAGITLAEIAEAMK